VGNVACMGEMRNVYQIFVRKAERDTTWETWTQMRV